MSTWKTKPHTTYMWHTFHFNQYITRIHCNINKNCCRWLYTSWTWSSLRYHRHQLILWENSIHDDYELVEDNDGCWNSVQYELIPWETILSTSLYFSSINLTLPLHEVHQTLKAEPIGPIIRLVIFQQLVWQTKPRLKK